ncbi:hypothetical protein ACFFSY_30010 [Paenibacillus aurantiacus]|uniref:Uncharacterized protein n=1 Tax=Paenibacillus aurantiacus TaxID=1936118 RepID=A0ABV5KY99_9BACL
MDIFSNLLFYNYMGCRKSQILRGLDRDFPIHLVFHSTYEQVDRVFEETFKHGRSGWVYPWKIDVSEAGFGIQEQSTSYANFNLAKQDIIDRLKQSKEVLLWTRNEYVPHMIELQSDPNGIHSLTVCAYLADSDSFRILDYPFEREYESSVVEQAFNHVPDEKKM